MEEVPRVIWECLGDITVRARFVQVTTVADLKRCMVYGPGMGVLWELEESWLRRIGSATSQAAGLTVG